ncbi:sensor histidine kinase [Lachnospiraceae bacterium 66-29]
MVINYLENLYQGLYEKKINLERENQKKEILLRDNIKFVQTLENTLDENYESFSPRKVDEESHHKINSLMDEQRQLEEEIRLNKIEIVDLSIKISELENIMKEARANERLLFSNQIEQSDDKIYKRNILEIQEMERQRIARDMHDTVVQNLTSLIHKIELCDKIGDVDPVRCKLELRFMKNIIRDTIQDLREIIFDLRPFSLEEISLENAIERELLKIRGFGIVNISYEVEGKSDNLSHIISLTVFRVIQEVCNNVLKHAQANNIFVKLSFMKEELLVSIKDDGNGFDVNAIDHFERLDNSGFGISMMRERVYLLSGKVEFNSKPGDGTEVIIKVPMLKEEK